MAFTALGGGLLYAYIPTKLAFSGFEPWVAGAILTATGAGGFLGCLVSGRLIRRVGHARVFSCYSSLIIINAVGLALSENPYMWMTMRFIYGISITGLFIVSQSWLNDVCENEWRGKVIAIFYMTYVLSIGFGSYILSFVELDGAGAPLLAIAFTAVAILPISLTKLRTPQPPESINIAIKSVWKISPVGLVGMCIVGGLTMLIQGFTPIYAAANELSKNNIALLMFFMQFGMILIQIPLGALSDRIDRRKVILLSAVIVIIFVAVATQLNTTELIWLILIFGICSGATESIFSISSAHANDRADPQYYVSLSSTLLIAWSLSGVIMPALTTLLMPYTGINTFLWLSLGLSVFYTAFVLYRMTLREPVPEENQTSYQTVSAQAPLTSELAPHQFGDNG
jgi:MFS family permease